MNREVAIKPDPILSRAARWATVVFVIVAVCWISAAIVRRHKAQKLAVKMAHSLINEQGQLYFNPPPPPNKVRVPLAQFLFNPFRNDCKCAVGGLDGWLEIGFRASDIQ